ncbi:BNR-4 repeat-containing protein [Granulosicoccus sp. 3-233]|uniref:BNR-4 repeat-containing protein n=1 Tax=Granulosicoccus sp. 3-233 TaxID=3417969 RepID=UPI003D32F2A0
MMTLSRTAAAGLLLFLSMPLPVSPDAAVSAQAAIASGAHCAGDASLPVDCLAEAAMPVSDARLDRIPSRMDNLYRYNVNSDSDLVTFYNRAEHKLQQVLTFYNEQRRLAIVIRDFPNGSWSEAVDIHQHIGNEALEYDSHNYTAFGVAADGTLFATANHHVDPLRMAISLRPYDITSFRQLPERSINPQDDDRVTYPSFSYLGEELYFSYREQEVGGGKPAFRWLLKRWNTSSRYWEDVAQLNTGTHLRLYVSNIAWNTDGTQLHLSALWRDDRPEVLSRSTEQQHDLFHLYSDDGRQWKQYGEGEVALPLLWSGAGQSTVPQLIWNTGKGDPVPGNAGSIAVDSDSHPHILNTARDGRLFYHHFDGRQWVSLGDVFRSGTDDVFQLPDGMGAVSARGDSLYFHRLSPELDRKGVLLAKGYVTRYYHASVDKNAIEHGWLSMMLTLNQHHAVGSKRGNHAVEAYVLSIPLSELDDFSTPYLK